jgi:signal transduction histidine kinase
MRVTRLINSAQIVLPFLVILAFITVGAFGVLIANNAADLEYTQRSVAVAARQSRTVIQIGFFADRYTETANQMERETLRDNIIELADTFEQTQIALRDGDATLDLDPITSREVLATVDELDFRWVTYRALVEEYIFAPLETRLALNEVIDSEAIIVSVFAERVVAALDAVARAQRISAQTITIVAAVVVGIVGLLLLLIIARTVRAISQLRATTEKLAAGDMNAAAPTRTVTELGDVGVVLNQMSTRLQKSIQDLEKQVEVANTARMQAEQADKVKSAFLASMSHELRTPLNSVINYTKFVSKGMMGDVNDRQRETLGKVVDSSLHLLDLINDVLDMSKIEAGSLTLFVETDVDVPAALSAAIDSAKPILTDKPVEMTVSIEPALPPITGDKQRIRQVFTNLLSNACKFTEQGTIKVDLKRDGDSFLVSVADTGPGIEDPTAVFTAFRQARAGLRAGGGTGLGMPISRSIIEAHGGRLWFTSEVGKGSTFYVLLPIKSELLAPTLA